MVHFLWLGICSLLLWLQYQYKNAEIRQLSHAIEKGKHYVQQKSPYYTEKELEGKGKLKIRIVNAELSTHHPVVLKFYDGDGKEQVETFSHPMISTYSGIQITKIESLNGHPFRFASAFEAGMEYQGATIYQEGNKGIKIPLETEGWEPHWILIFDK